MCVIAAVPETKSEEDIINNILKEHGVKYSHINEHVLVENPMEEQRSRAAVKVYHQTSAQNLTLIM